jgi:hypothetical protein
MKTQKQVFSKMVGSSLHQGKFAIVTKFFRTVTFGEPMLIHFEYTHSYKMNKKPL